jgi:hypothetical protein
MHAAFQLEVTSLRRPAALIVRDLPLFHNLKVSIGKNGASDLTYYRAATYVEITSVGA